MIGFHIQNSPQDWPKAVAKLPAGAVVKFLFGVERCREAKQANPGIKTWYRWVGDQPLPPFGADFEQPARDWLNNFVDGTFRREAQYVDYIQEYNETFSNSQDASERIRWVSLHTAMAKVWYEEYRKEPELAHIRMILAETAVGNDIPLDVAQAAVMYDALLGYHPYIPVRNHTGLMPPSTKYSPHNYHHNAPRASFHETPDELYVMQLELDVQAATRDNVRDRSEPDVVMPGEWSFYSGRWETMDKSFAAAGVRPDWIFGESGVVRDASPDWSGWLDPQGGWRHPEALNGDIDRYLAVLKYWLDNATTTAAYRDGRVKGSVIFTSGGPGTLWKYFELAQPHMNAVADLSRNYPYPTDPPPPDESWQQALWNESVELQTISLNPNAALQAAIFADGFTPVQSEFWSTVDGIQFASQAAETINGYLPRRVYYTVRPIWSDVQWFTEPDGGLQAGDKVVDLSYWQARKV